MVLRFGECLCRPIAPPGDSPAHVHRAIQGLMVDSLKKPEFQEIRPGVKAPAKDTILTPRFYTTDFDEMAAMDISVNEEELLAILDEFRADYNRHHFVRSDVFAKSWDSISGETRQLFVEFLERSCTTPSLSPSSSSTPPTCRRRLATGGISPSSATSSLTPRTRSTRSSDSLRTGARTKIATATFSRP